MNAICANLAGEVHIRVYYKQRAITGRNLTEFGCELVKFIHRQILLSKLDRAHPSSQCIFDYADKRAASSLHTIRYQVESKINAHGWSLV